MKAAVSFTPKNPSYFPFTGRFLVALFVAHYIVVHAQAKPVLEIMQQSNYYVALAFSLAFALLLIQLIHTVTKILDGHCSWLHDPPMRLVLQFIFGVLTILILDILLVWCYFTLFGKDFWSSGYMSIEFHTVAWMVVSLNVMYGAWFYMSNFYRVTGLRETMPSQSDEKPLAATLGQKKLYIVPSEVICFLREDYVGFACLKDGNIYNIDYRMSDLQNILPQQHFYQINRSVFVNRDAIQGYTPVGNNQAELTLRYDVKRDLNLKVSRERYKAFLAFLDQDDRGIPQLSE